MNKLKNAVDTLRSLVEEEPGFVDGWVLLLALYIQDTPMDSVVKIAEEAIHKCEHDVEVVYYYTSWLFREVGLCYTTACFCFRTSVVVLSLILKT